MRALDGLVDVTAVARASMPLRDVLREVAETVAACLGFRVVVVNIRRPADDDLQVMTVVGEERGAEQLLHTTLSNEQWQMLLDPRFDRDGVFFVPGGELDLDAMGGPYYVSPDADVRSDGDQDVAWQATDMLLVPLSTTDGALLGVLSLDDPASGHRPSALTRRVLAAVGRHVALAIEQRLEAARSAAHTVALEQLFTVTADILETTDAISAARLICTAVGDVLGFEQVSVALPRTDESFAVVDRDLVLDAAAVARLLTTGTPRHGVRMIGPDDAALWPAPPPTTPFGRGPQAWQGDVVVVPLRDSLGKLAGLVRVSAPYDRLLPDRDRLATLGMFAAQAAAILDSAAQRALREERDRALHLATHDPLTGLPNRTALRRGLTERLEAGARSSVLFLDLDDFKIVNDAVGHHLGDEVLRSAGDRLARAATPHILFRLGGDEFAVLVDGPETTTVAEALHAALGERFRFAGIEHPLTASIGVTAADAGLAPSEVLKRADIAMYQAKTSGGGRTVVYDPIADAAAVRLETVTALRTAIERNELTLHFQPIVDPADGRVTALEALLRWYVDGRFVPPLEFIPLAESTGLIAGIGAWVIDEAARQSRAWRDAGVDVPPIAVNISPLQLQRGTLTATISTALEDHDLHPSALTVEITESSLLPDPRTAAELDGLRRMGVRCAIDDFGAAYSSLGRLLELPVDVLKVDRAFLRQVPEAPRAVGLLHAVIHLAAALKLGVVVEGVETADQQAELQRSDVPVVCQGFHFSRPLPAEAVPATLAGRS